MYFCPNCNNVFDVVKASSQFGGYMSNLSESSDFATVMKGGLDYETILKKVLKTNEALTQNEIEQLSINDLVKSNVYKKLKFKEKEYVFNKIQDLLPTEKKKIFKEESIKQPSELAYFICNNCGYMKKIEDGTLVFSRVSQNVAQSYATTDITNMKHSDILPRTRKYICPNEKCQSHTNPLKREAVFFRMNNTFKVKYICLSCDTSFSN
jgi:hypothetical protein